MKDKVPFYNLVNMFFVGAVFSLCMLFLLYDYIPVAWIKENSELLADWTLIISAVLLVAMYEIGFIINRMGSVIVAPVLEKTKIWPKESYDIDVSEISASNSKFQSMITELVLMRSHIMMCLLLAGVSIFQSDCRALLFFLFVLVVFVLGGRKHNAKINKIRKSYAENNKKKRITKVKVKIYNSV